jgi:hypothetical protein
MLDAVAEPLEVRHDLQAGVLNLRMGLPVGQVAPFKVAERINPKRAFLFVSTVLGRHIPVRPADHFAAVDALVEKCDPEGISGPVLVMGYAETAVGLGAAVARGISRRAPDADLIYLSTTRHPVPGRAWVGFSEGHSHATDHHVLHPGEHKALTEEGVTLVLVDDETTTGSTFAGLTAALIKGGVRPGRVLLVTLTDWSDGAADQALRDLLPNAQVRSVSLTKGAWSWTPEPSAPRPEIPGGVSNPYPSWVPPGSGAPRDGVCSWTYDHLDRVAGRLSADLSAHFLIIGTGEHVWEPMLLGEALERAGAEVRVVATTRSPIFPGEVIRHRVTFPDHFGIGVPMYLHNVPPRPDARVVVVTETAADRICPALRSHLGSGVILDRTGQIKEFSS